MKFRQVTQEQLDEEFIQACKQQDFPKIKSLVERYPLKKKSSFDAFLSLVGMKKPIVNMYAKEAAAIYSLCEQGNGEIISYLIEQPVFQASLKDNNNLKILSNALHRAIAQQHFHLIDILGPIAKECDDFYYSSYHTFVQACAMGNLPVVKFLLTDQELDVGYYCAINNQYNEFAQCNEGFRDACEHGNLDIVQYLTTSPDIEERVNLLDINAGLHINNFQIIQHFIFNLEIPQDHHVWQYISYGTNDNLEIEELYERKALFENLSHQLPDSQKKKPKRNKV